MFNLLSIMQFGILIDVLELLRHNVQPVPDIGRRYSHYCYLRRLEVYSTVIEDRPITVSI